MKPILITGNSHIKFAKALSKHLKIPLSGTDIHQYSDGETYVRIMAPNSRVRGKEGIIIQTGSAPAHDNFIEILLLSDALKRMEPRRMTAVIPFLPYRRQEHLHEEGEGVGGELIARLFRCAGIDCIITSDLHHESFKRFFKGHLLEVSALPLFAQHFKKVKNTIIVSPDEGGIGRAQQLADMMSAPMMHLPKVRSRHDHVKRRKIKREISHECAIIVDDEINTARTIDTCVDALWHKGLRDIRVAATHPVLSGQAVKRLNSHRIKEIVFADTIPITKGKRIKRCKILSLAPLIARTIEDL